MLALLLANPASSELQVWLDANGHPHLSDAPPPPGARAPAEGELWLDGPRGDTQVAWGDSSEASSRVRRQLRSALEDLRRGEAARAQVALEDVLRDEPGRPEPHFFLALLARQRGRFELAEVHLRAFLASAGDELEPWRRSARRRLRALQVERALADGSTLEPLRLVELPSDHFDVQVDAALAQGADDYSERVLGFLEEARAAVGGLLGSVPSEPTGVVLYGKAAYRQAWRHRFSFETVGFFDGRIHVVSAAHPAGELRSLLFHEYVHALFEERSGGHRPFWLNEGFAELAEHRALGRPPLTRSEQGRLRAAIQAGHWIPLERLAPSFGGLDDSEARLAYLVSTSAALWVEARTAPSDRARLLDRLAAGEAVDSALLAVLGVDTQGLDAAVRREILAQFPPI